MATTLGEIQTLLGVNSCKTLSVIKVDEILKAICYNSS